MILVYFHRFGVHHRTVGRGKDVFLASLGKLWTDFARGWIYKVHLVATCRDNAALFAQLGGPNLLVQIESKLVSFLLVIVVIHIDVDIADIGVGLHGQGVADGPRCCVDLALGGGPFGVDIGLH